jgi:crotonobetainyl-CoA:carnitine CoA-transferase CaiB-like acyl-CoA transferase
MERLRGVVPAAPVRSLEEALEPGRLDERGMLAEYEHPTLGRVRSVGLPLFFSDYEPTYRPGPGMGADEASVLADLGYDQGQVEALRSRGAFGVRHAAESQGEAAATGAPL